MKPPKGINTKKKYMPQNCHLSTFLAFFFIYPFLLLLLVLLFPLLCHSIQCNPILSASPQVRNFSFRLKRLSRPFYLSFLSPLLVFSTRHNHSLMTLVYPYSFSFNSLSHLLSSPFLSLLLVLSNTPQPLSYDSFMS